jgi:hypothetical protein
MTSATVVACLMRVMICPASIGRRLNVWPTVRWAKLHGAEKRCVAHANHLGNFCDRHRPGLAHGAQFCRRCRTGWRWFFRRRWRTFDRTFSTAYVPSGAVSPSVVCAFFAARTQCLQFQQGPPSGSAQANRDRQSAEVRKQKRECRSKAGSAKADWTRSK